MTSAFRAEVRDWLAAHARLLFGCPARHAAAIPASLLDQQ